MQIQAVGWNYGPGWGCCRAAVNALFQAFPALPRAQLGKVLATLQAHVLAPAAGVPPHVQAGAFGDVALSQVRIGLPTTCHRNERLGLYPA